MNTATWIMGSFTGLVAVFTFLLWRATDKYAETTKELLNQSKETVKQSKLLTEVTRLYAEITNGLLEQSKEAVKQSRISFLGNIIHGTIEYVEKLPTHNKTAEETKHVLSKAEAFKTISVEVYTGFLKAMVGYAIGNQEQIKKELKKAEKEPKEEGESWEKFLGWGKG